MAVRKSEPFKRYMCFGYEDDGPCGLRGVRAEFDTLEEALAWDREQRGQIAEREIFDRVEGVEIWDDED